MPVLMSVLIPVLMPVLMPVLIPVFMPVLMPATRRIRANVYSFGERNSISDLREGILVITILFGLKSVLNYTL